MVAPRAARFDLGEGPSPSPRRRAVRVVRRNGRVDLTDLRTVVRKLKGRTAAELRDRTVQAARAALERAGLAADSAPLTLAAALLELRDEAGRPFASPSAALEAFVVGQSPFTPSFSDRAATLAAVDAADPGARARLIDAARRIGAGRHDVLGYTALDYGSPPDWQRDPVLGRRAPMRHWSTIPYLDAAAIGDHKVTWELNRQQWVVTLAQAWWWTGDADWAERAARAVDAWIDENPPKRGVNWTSSLEVAFRSISWVWTLHLLRGSAALTAERYVRWMGTLAVAARHVANNLSTWFSPNTHLTGEALGLLSIGCGAKALRDAPHWRATGATILARHVPQHVRADGTYVEQSTWYARYTADFLVHAIVVGEASGEATIGMRDALGRLATYLMHVARADGTLPLIGDDDGGRLLFLDRRPADDVRPTLGAAAALLGRADLAWAAGPARAEACWLLGAQGFAALRALEPAVPTTGSRAFRDGGVFVMRDGWGPEASVAILDCGVHGMLGGGHAHADLLSVDLTVGGTCVVRDPGTYTYTVSREERDRFRRAASHATVTVDGCGSATPSGPFSWAARPSTPSASWGTAPGVDALLGSHDGFASLADPVMHHRAVLHAHHAYWLLVDRIEARGAHDITVHFPLAPGIGVTLDGARVALRRDGVDVAQMEAAAGSGAWQVEEGWQSRAYGQKERSTALAWRIHASGDDAAATLVARTNAPSLTRVPAAGAAFVMEADGWRDLIVLGTGGPCDVDSLRVAAALAWVRRDRHTGRPVATLLLGATRLEVHGTTLFASDAPIASAWATGGRPWTTSGVGWQPDALSAAAVKR